MNKIYKVVWNKARNCYVVASEFAKNHQTGSSRIKAASVAAVMAATMLTIGTGVIYAANVTDTDVKESKETILFDNTPDTATNLNNPNLKHDHPGSWVHGHTDKCGELTYNTTLTIGDINNVVDKLVANDTSLYNQGIKNVTMKDGKISLIRNGKSSVTDSIALTGTSDIKDQDTAVTVTVGNESQTFNTGSVVRAKTDASGKATGLTINGTSYDIKAGSDYHWDLKIKGKQEKEVANDAKVVFGNSDDNITVTDDPLEDQDKKNLHVSVGLNSTVTIGTKKDGTYNKEAITIDGKTGHITGLQNKTWDGTTIESGRAATEDQLQQVAQSVKTYKPGENVTIANDGTISATDTKYSAGNNVTIDKDNTISVDLSKYAKSDDVAVVYDKNKTALKTTNSNGVGEKAIALGKGASAVKNSIAIGNGAYTQDGTFTRGQSVALGNGAVTGAKSTSIGSNAIGGREGTITIGANANNGAVYATIIGTDSKLNYESKTSGAASTMIGAKNEIKNDDKRFSGVANGILGASNTIENSNGVTIQGSANTVTNAYRDMAPTYQTGEERYNLGGVSVKKDTGAVGILGGMNKVSNQVYTNVIGFGNTLSGDKKISSHDVFLAGSRNKLTNISDALVMGNDNTITDQAEVISLGNKTQITANQATAIGNKTVVSADGGVAIGTNSVANRVVKEGSTGAFAPDTITDTEKSIWTATAGAVSVGDAKNNITRQITNVAAGSEDTDAVNVAQLKQVNSKADSATEMANKGWNLSTNSDKQTTQVKPGETVDFSGDDNITVSNKDTKVKVALNKNINVNNVQTNALNAKYNLSVGTAADNGTMPFFVNSNGAFYAAGSKFVVEKDGSVKATSGDIGNVTLNNGVFYKNSALRNGELYIGDTEGNYSQITSKNAKLGKVTIDDAGRISGVAAGRIAADSTDAVNGSQLKGVESIANKGWNLSTNNVATEATNVAPGDYVDFSGDDNITVSNKDTKVKVALNKNINVNNVQTNALNAKYNLSVGTAADNGTMPFFVNSNGAFYAAGSKFVVEKDGSVKATSGDIGNVTLNNGVFYKNSALRDGELYIGDTEGNYSQITSKNAKLGKVTIDDAGRISGVAAGRIATDSTDAVNGSQLHAVQQEAGKHTKVVNGSNITVDEIDQNGQKTYKVGLNKDILLGDATGKNVNISGTNGTIETTGYIATKDRVYADKGAKLADVDITKDTLSNGPSKVVLNEGYAGIAYGDTSIALMPDNVVLNSKVTVGKDGKISGVAAGRIAADSTDAVNGSQLNAVQQEAGKHTKVVNGSNITVDEIDQNGQKTYKVGLNKDILLGDATGKNVNISGTNGTIETTGYIATKDRVYADKGAKLADVDITKDTLSNGPSKVVLNEGYACSSQSKL